jgi:hypothetical protein
MEFPLLDVRRPEVSVGRQRDLGARIGGWAGLLGGVGVGVVWALSFSGPGGANMAAIGLPLFTAPAGAVIGALVGPHRYLTVPQPYRNVVPRDDRPPEPPLDDATIPTQPGMTLYRSEVDR